MRTHRLTKLALAAGAASILAFGSAGISANAAPAPALIGTANGVVGVPQTVEVRAPGFANQTVTLTYSVAGQAVTTTTVAINAAGSGSTVWTPTQAGTWSVGGAGSFASASASALTVSAVPTITTLYAVNQAQVNVATTLTAVVTPTSGSYVPAGSVIFTTAFGSVLGTAPLTQNGASSSIANLSWTSTSPAVVPIVATYSPAAGLAGGANAQASSSQDQIEVLTGQPLVTLKLPGNYVQGRTTNVTAVVTQGTAPSGSPMAGSVSLISNVNGTQTGISGSIPLASNNEATAAWTPTSSGNQIIIAQFTSSNSYLSGQAQQIISVLPTPAADPISLGQAGQAAWAPGSTVSLPANATVNLSVTSGSGAPVSISEAGPCMVSGASLITATGAGTCTLTASSPGTSAYSPNSATVTIQVSPAPAKK